MPVPVAVPVAVAFIADLISLLYVLSLTGDFVLYVYLLLILLNCIVFNFI